MLFPLFVVVFSGKSLHFLKMMLSKPLGPKPGPDPGSVSLILNFWNAGSESEHLS